MNTKQSDRGDAEPKNTSRWLERWVHLVLLAGLIVSGLLLSVGLALVLARQQVPPGGPPLPLSNVLRRAIRGDGESLLELGLLALIATPVLRVAILAIGWTIDRQWRFALVSLTVLGLLIFSMILGTG